MDTAALLRAARQAGALSQRALAGELGVSPAAVARAELPVDSPLRRDLPPALLGAALALVGWELTVAPRGPALTPAQRAHLRASTTVRLRHALATPEWQGPMRLRPPTREGWQRWQELGHLLRAGPHQPRGPSPWLGPLLAAAVWLPVPAPPAPRPLHLPPGCVTRGRGAWPSWTLVDEPVDAGGLVRVAVGQAHVRVPTPLALSAVPELAPLAAALRAVATALDEEQRRDRGGRRPAAHRQPDERGERGRLEVRKAYDPRALPEPGDARRWRLGGPASLAQWLTERGAPLPPGTAEQR